MTFDTKEVVCKFVFISEKTDLGFNPDTHKYDRVEHQLTFRAVADNSPENKLFWKYTPSGTFEFTTVNPEAAKMFKFGHEYYVTFREAPMPEIK
jgi:hypothetical protein